MKVTRGGLGNSIVAIVIVVGAIAWVTHQQKGDRTAANEGKPTQIVTVSPSTPRPSATPTPIPPPEIQQLAHQLDRLVSTYYLLLPDDTAALRRQRLTSFKPSLPTTVMNELHLFGSPAEMTNERLSRRGHVKAGSLTAQQVGPQNEVYVVAQVITQMIGPDAKTIQTSTFPIGSMWEKQSGTNNWTIIHFSEGGEEE